MKSLVKIASISCLCLIFASCRQQDKTAHMEDRYPQIFPDYAGVTVPPNIAPLNFMVTEENTEVVKMNCIPQNGNPITMNSKQKIRFPEKKWKKMLQNNHNGTLMIEISVKRAGQWVRFRSFDIHVAPDPIDSYLAYRLIDPGYVIWKHMGIYQRCLESFDETPVITNRLTDGNCMNCHSFCRNDPNTMLFHMRDIHAGTMIWQNGQLRKLDTGTEQIVSRGVYPSWHPSGRFVAFSTNVTRQNFHAIKNKKVEVWDAKSDIVVLDIEENKLLKNNLLMSKTHFETFPAWSPDGQYLYFCSADSLSMPDQYDRLKYNLLRIGFDPVTQSFSTQIDTIISARKTGKSISFPRVSPDGKYLLFTQSGYGNFSIWHKDADLYLLHLATGELSTLPEVNSNDTESYHTWSSNSRWFVFSSRRIDGLYTRSYFSWVDENGTAHKPFLLPQKDPEHSFWLMKSYNVPELIRGKIHVSPYRINQMARQPEEKPE
ncbi:MAG: hypothetical protein LBM08_05575 [Dysgonamonadaceae bacterium]|nr:hypothetical protein [Dysgonamonadaceae bacterium]